MVDIVFQSQYVEDLESGFSSDVESKYKKIYEDDINPFAAFSKKVKNKTFCYHRHKPYISFLNINPFLFICV